MGSLIKICRIAFVTFSAISITSVAFPEDKDIGLHMHIDGANISLAGCSSECPASPLKIYKGAQVKGVKIVPDGDPAASRLKIRTSGVTKAVKKYTPTSGNFNPIMGPDKGSITFVSSITCKCANGTTKRFGETYAGSGIYSAYVIFDLVKAAIAAKGLSIPTPPIWGGGGSDPCLFMRTYSGSWNYVNVWYDGTYDVQTLNAICNILGYDQYVSSTCQDDERSGLYPNGKCNWHSTGDNCISYFTP